MYGNPQDPLECLDMGNPDDECKGKVEYRMALSATGVSFPRCDHHWAQRLDLQEETNRKYPVMQPSDFDPSFAGERWDDDY